MGDAHTQAASVSELSHKVNERAPFLQRGPVFSSAPICPSALSGDRVPPWPSFQDALSPCPMYSLTPTSFHPGGHTQATSGHTDLLPNKCPWKICFNEHHGGQEVNNLRGNGAGLKMLCFFLMSFVGRSSVTHPWGTGDPLKVFLASVSSYIKTNTIGGPP